MPIYKYDIGIVIVSYNVRHFLEQCLLSVQKAIIDGLKVEVWVVDNASVDGTKEMMQAHFPDVHFMANENNVGFSAANNQAIRQMNAKYVLLLNPDTIVEEKTLKVCYDFMEHRPKAGVTGVRMIDGAGIFLPESKRSVPNLWNSFCKLFYLSDIFPKSKYFSGYNLGYLPEMETNKIEVLCGAFMFIRSSVLDETGLLDEAFFMYGEDIDLSFRILQAGYEVWYYPETTIIHYKGESTKKGSFNYLKTFYGAMQIYVSKHYGQGDAKLFTQFINFAITIRGIISGIVGLMTKGFRPLTDMVLMISTLFVVKNCWAEYYFQNSTYYDKSPTWWIFGGYALIWIATLSWNGYYKNVNDVRKRITSMALGTMLILVIYALIPEYFRTSRAIILLGAVAGFIMLTLSAWILSRKDSKKKMRTTQTAIAIVASEKNALILKSVLQNFYDCENWYIIAPNQELYNAFFTNTLEYLPDVVSKLGIGEVIYGSEDVTMERIIQSMTTIGQEVSFKIGSADSQKIIGSDDRNEQGAMFTLKV